MSVMIRAVKNIREGDVPARPDKALPWVGRKDRCEEVTFEWTPEGYEGTRHVKICVTSLQREAWRWQRSHRASSCSASQAL